MISLGADVAKDSIVIFDGNSTFTVANKPTELRKFLVQHPGARLAVEPTGGMQDLICQIAFKLGMTVYVIQSSWIRSHRRGIKPRGKTDKIDAQTIQDFLVERADHLHIWRPLPKLLAELRLTLRQRQGLAKDLSRMRQRYRALKLAKAHLEALLKPLHDLIQMKDDRLKELLEDIPNLASLELESSRPAQRSVR